MHWFFPVLLSCTIATISMAQVVQVGRLRHFAIAESSGLVASRQYPGVIWTHNDGGYQFLFAVNKSGRKLGAFQVPGNLIDWEDIAIDNAGNLYLADIGTNGMARSHLAVHRVKEPNPYARYGNANILHTWLLRFPEGTPDDCESFFVHRRHGYLITKSRVNGRVHMYRYPLSDRSRSVPLQFVTSIETDGAVSAADLSRDEQRLGLVTGEGVYLIFVNGRPANAGTADRRFVPFVNTFMEGGTFFGRGFLTSAETRELWLFTDEVFRCQTPPRLTLALTNRTTATGATIRFEVAAEGCPAPTFRWNFNGQALPGATNAALVLPNVSAANAGEYQVVISNLHGTISSTAVLTVRSRRNVRITEVMSSPALGSTIDVADWWELTNFEDTAVDLTGWRFNDSVGGLDDPYVLINGPIIEPGETVIFVENLSADEFRAWWGVGNLSPDLKIVSYAGNGLSFRITGDTLHLWAASATDVNDTVDQASFGPAVSGVTFTYDPASGAFGVLSQLGLDGTFRAESGFDIGSPGQIAAPE